MSELFGTKRYNSLDYFFKNKFSTKVAKIPLSGGFTCPNRDGTKGVGGCIYCSDKLSGEFAGKLCDSIEKQFSDVAEMLSKKWKNTKYMPYFQTGTATYACVEKLRSLYEEALRQKDVVGLSIATRPDCISDEVLSLLVDISKKTFLTVELGLQTIHDKTGAVINRCSTFHEFEESFKRLKDAGIDICVHLINGLPFETRDMMMESVRVVSDMKPWSVKLHLLHIIRGTVCEEMYEKGTLPVFEKDDYVELICDQIEVLDRTIVLQRLTGDGERNSLVAPLWSIKKFEVLNAIDKTLACRNSVQGIKANK